MNSRCRSAAAGITAFLASTASAALAQTPPKGSQANSSSGSAQTTEKIEVTAPRGVDERRESTAAKIVVQHDEIVRFGDSSLADVLQRLPGITIDSAPGGGGEIRLRGLGSGYTQILINGEPTPQGFSPNSLSPELIERIEIYRAATAELGAQAIAGTINIILRKPSTREREVKLGAAEENDQGAFRLDAQVSDKHGALAYSLPLAMSHQRTDHPATAQQFGTNALGQPFLINIDPQSRFDTADSIELSPRLVWTVEPARTLTWESLLRYVRNRIDFSERTTTLLGAPPPNASDTLPIPGNTEMAKSTLAWKSALANDAKLESTLSLSHNRRHYDAFFTGYDEQGAFALERIIQSTARDDGLASKGKYTLPFVASHVLAVGWDGSYAERAEYRLEHDVTPSAPPSVIDESYDARVRRLALYGQDEWDITSAWSTYLGLRWEGLDTRSIGNVITGVHNTSSVWSPIVQALWKVPRTEGDQVRASLARTYKPPTTFELMPRRYIANNNTATTPDFQGNPDLRPELAWSLDAAYEHYLPEKGLFSVAVYYRRIDNVLLRELSNVNGTWISQPFNDGQATVRGIEIEAKFALRSLLERAPAVDIRANLSRNWSVVDGVPGPNNRLDRQTPFSANLGLDYAIQRIPLTLGGNFTFTSGGPVRLSLTQTEDNSVKRVLDLYALWKIGPKAQFRVTIANALAQDFVSVAEYFDENGTLQQTTTRPSYRTVRALLEVKF